jgi:predicted Zn-dependent protease
VSDVTTSQAAASTHRQAYFDELVTTASTKLQGDEVLLANLAGESTDFIRLNNNDVRQAGSVDQQKLSVDLIEGQRHVGGTINVTGDRSMDDTRVAGLLAQLRDQRRLVPDDPYLLFNTEPTTTDNVKTGDIPTPDAALADIRTAGQGKDLVGIYASGDTFHGFANSLGQRNWFQSSTFNLDWCFYLQADKAAKNIYAGFDWSDDAFARKVDWSSQQLTALARDPKVLGPGDYRTYLAPRAMEEVMSLLSYYGAFGKRAHETKQSPFLRMLAGDATLSPQVSISENTAGGVAPNFESAGFVRPDAVQLIVDGKLKETLVSPRSAQEYGVATNGAHGGEYPESMAIAPGTIPTDGVAEELGTGLFVGNLWYTNFSDMSACRTTGMTRFATFWMDSGEIVAPVSALRFDDTAFNMLGDRLEGLTDDAEVLLDPSTYMERSTASARLPGALLSGMRFVL